MAFKKPFAALFFTACPKPDLPLPLPTLVSFFRMGILEVGGFFCMVGGSGKRRFFFTDTVPGMAGVTSIAFRFGVVPLMIFLNMFSNGLLTIPSSTSSGVGAVTAGLGPRRIGGLHRK